MKRSVLFTRFPLLFLLSGVASCAGTVVDADRDESGEELSWSCAKSAHAGRQIPTCGTDDNLHYCNAGAPLTVSCDGLGCVRKPLGTSDECVLAPTPTPTPGTCGVASAYTWPTPGHPSVIQGFHNPIAYQSCGFHTGIDISAPVGAEIVAAGAGKVVYVGNLWFDQPGTGRGPYAIVIEHGPNLYSTYSHDRVALVKAGDCVTAGQKIAEIGLLGYTTGPHLHFEFVSGTRFTGNWKVPFANVCSAYRDPLSYVSSH